METPIYNIEKPNNNINLYNFDPNTLISMSFNFDILKYVITEIIKNQKNSNDELLHLKEELLESKKYTSEIETSLIEIKLLANNPPDIKRQLEEERIQIQLKISEIEKEIENLKNKEIFDFQVINNKIKKNESIIINDKNETENNNSNVNKNERINTDKNIDNISNNNKIDNKDNKEKKINENKEDKGKEVIEQQKRKEENTETNKSKSSDNSNEKINMKKANEIYKQVETIISEIKNLKLKQIILEKDFVELKNSEEKNISEKINNSLPNIENNLNSKIEFIKKKLNENYEKNSNDIILLQNDLKNKSIEINKSISELKSKENEDNKSISDLQESIKDLFSKVNILNECIPLYTKLTDFRHHKSDILEKINGEKKEININITLIQKSLNTLKTQFYDFIKEQNEHNNTETLLRKYEIIQTSIYKLQEFQKDFEEKEKRKVILDPNKYVKVEAFNDYINNVHKNFDLNKKEFLEMHKYLDDFKSKEIRSKASLKDLKILEDNIFTKMEDLKRIISEKFVDKNLLNKNTKIIELQTKQLIEDNKKNEKMENWLLARRPLGNGHLCASCESYLGDLNQDSSKFIPWNKYPQKDVSEKKLFKIGGGFSKILQMVDSKNNSIIEDRYCTSSRNESKENNSFKKFMKNEPDNPDIKYNLPKIAINKRKNNSTMNIFNSELSNRSTYNNNSKLNNNSKSNEKMNNNLNKTNNQINKKDISYIINDNKIELKEDEKDKINEPKMTKVIKKY